MSMPVTLDSITLDTVLYRSHEVHYASCGPDEAVMMSAINGAYYGLNAVSSRIWELLEIPCTIAQLCTSIVKEFEIDQAHCEASVLKFTHDLVNHNLVLVSPT